MRVDREDGPGEVAGEQSPEDLVTDAARSPTGSNDGDRARPEKALDARRGGNALALLTTREVVGGRFQVESDPDRPLDEPAHLVQSGVGENREHHRILRKRFRDEMRDAPLACVGGKAFEQ